MRITIRWILAATIGLGVAPAGFSQPAEIHCKHFFFGYPTGMPPGNDLIIRDIYALSSNDDTKFADWVAFRLDEKTVAPVNETGRVWVSDPWLDATETLEPADYVGANAALKVDRGHQAPLASFRGTEYWSETNYLSNITPQRSALNQGPWMQLEDKERGLVEQGYIVYVVTGPLYERPMAALPEADEAHRIPSAYCRIISIMPDDDISSIQTAAFILDQNTSRNAKFLDSLVTIDEIERRSGLDFLRELPDNVEASTESTKNEVWAREVFE